MNKAQREVAEYLLDKEERIIRQLERQYQLALEDVEMDIRILLMDEQTPSRIHRVEYQRRLKKQIETTLETLHRNEYKTINAFLQDSYKDSFVGTMYDLHSQGVPVIVPIDQNAAVKAIQLDTQLSDRKIHPNSNGEHVTLYESLGVDVDNLKETIRLEITRGLATNMQPEVIARNIANLTKAPLSRAKTIARTEAHRIQQASAQDAREKAISRGANVVKQWDATMDGATRKAHRELDGKIVEVNEHFVYGSLKAMYPGDFGDPAQDCNCRCVAVQRARWALGEEELEEQKRRAEFFGLGEDEAKKQQFAEYEKKYLKAESDIKKAQDKQAQIRARREAYKAREAAKKAQVSVPDFSEMNVAQIKQWADEHLKTAFEDVKGANKEFMAEAVKAVATFENKMGGRTIPGLSVKFGGVPAGTYAKYDDATKTVLLKKTGSLRTFTESQEKANTRYRLKWHSDKDYYATTTFSGTIFHEIGHAVDIDSGQALSRLLSVDPYLFEASVQVSAYAGSSQNVRVTPRSEAWAENFAAYMAGGKNATKVPKEIVDMIEDYFSGRR